MRRMGLKAQVAAHWSTWAVARDSSDARGPAIVASPPPSAAASTTTAAAARSGRRYLSTIRIETASSGFLSPSSLNWNYGGELARALSLPVFLPIARRRGLDILVSFYRAAQPLRMRHQPASHPIHSRAPAELAHAAV